MASTLLLHIPDLPQFESSTSLRWDWMDAPPAITRRGESALGALPKAASFIAIAPVSRVLFLETVLPPVSPAKRDALLRYAIEDKLSIDPATVHAVVLGPGKNGAQIVAAIDRGWLKQVLAWLASHEIALDALVSTAACVAATDDQWIVSAINGHGFAKRADRFVHHFELDLTAANPTDAPFALTLAMDEARRDARCPKALVLHIPFNGEPQSGARLQLEALCLQWSNALGLAVQLAGESVTNDLGTPLLANVRAENLLTGEFRPQSTASALSALVKPLLIGVCILLAVQLLMTIIENQRLKRAESRLDTEMRALFQTTFPTATAIVDPALQMRRNLDALRREQGVNIADPALAAVARLARVRDSVSPPPSVTSVTLANGELTVEFAMANAEQGAALRRIVLQDPSFQWNSRITPESPDPLAVIRTRVTP